MQISELLITSQESSKQSISLSEFQSICSEVAGISSSDSFAYQESLSAQQPPLTGHPRALSLVLSMQLFSVWIGKYNDSTQKNTHSYNEAAFSTSPMSQASASPVNSPRGKSTNTNTINVMSIATTFIRNNYKMLLSIANPTSTDMADSDLVDISGFLLFLDKSDRNRFKLSERTRMFEAKGATVSVTILNEWLRGELTAVEEARSPTSQDDDRSMAERMGEEVVIKNVNKSVVVRDDLDGKSLTICNSQSAHVQVDSVVNVLVLRNLRDCTVFVGGCAQVMTVDKCEECSLTMMCALLRIGNSVDCKINVASMRSPVLQGDSRSLTLGPHNAVYKNLPKHLSALGVIANTTTQNSFKNPTLFCLLDTNQLFKLQDPKEQSLLVLPDSITGMPNVCDGIMSAIDNSPLAPVEYNKVLYLRKTIWKSWQRNIAESGLKKEHEINLHAALQGHFREWLVSTGNIRSVVDLVKMIE